MGRYRRRSSVLLTLLILCWSRAASANVGDIRTNLTPFTQGITPLTILWSSPFPDTSYTAVCTAEGIPDDQLLPVITARTPTSMTIVPTAAAMAGVLDCMAVPDSDQSTLRHARTTFTGNPRSITALWNQPFRDTNYTAVCTGESANPQNHDFTGAINVVTRSSVTFANGGLNAGTLHCIAISDTDPGQLRHGTATFSNAPLTVEVPWSQPFSNAGYAAVCTNVAPPGTGPGSAITTLVGSKLPASIVVVPQIPSGTADCIAGANPQLGSSTTLTVSPPSPVSAGQVVTLTASVVDQFTDPVTVGTVTFYSGSQVLGTVQAIASPPTTAILKSRFAPGSYSLTAQYNPNNSFSGSISSAQPLTVTGTEPTISTLSAAPNGNNYDFSLSVFGFGFPTLSGSATLNNLTAGGTLLGTIDLAGPGIWTFQPATTFPVGAAPTAVVTGDFNNDGIPDLAVTNSQSQTVSVLLGNGDGTFRHQQTVPVGTGEWITTFDFNGDGALDLAVANAEGNVGVLLGNGDGTFQQQLRYSVIGDPRFLAVGDFNQDGEPDLAVITEAPGQGAVLAILLNNGDGTFTPEQQTFPAGQSSAGIVTADFNNDGNADIATVDISRSEAVVLPGNGNGTFQPALTFAVGSSNTFSQALAVGDLNGDGQQDLVVLNNLDDTISVLLGNGDGTFQPQSVVDVGSSPVGVAIADFNGDGIPDLAIADLADNAVRVLLGHGDGSFQPQPDFAVAAPGTLAPADLNGDGVPDLAAISGDNAGILLGGSISTGELTDVPISGLGSQSIQSTFTPNEQTYSGSQSNIVIVTGSTLPTTTVLTSSLNPSTYLQAVTFTATVTSSGGGSPTGTVTFALGSNVICSAVPLMTGRNTSTATCTTQSLPIGSDTILASFTDPQGRYGNSSASLTQTVRAATGDFAFLPISPGSVTVTQTFNNNNDPFFAQTIKLAVQPINGYNNSVSLSCNITPPLTGGTCIVNSPASGSLAPGDLHTTLTISAGGKTPLGLYLVTVTGQDNSGLMHTAALNLTVINYAARIEMPPGGEGTTTILFPGSAGTAIGSFACPKVTGTGLAGEQNFSSIHGSCSFMPSSGTIPDPITVTLSGCTVASLNTRAPVYALFLLGLPGIVLLGSSGIGARRRKRTLQVFGLWLTAFAMLIGTGCGGLGQLSLPGDYNVLIQGTGSDGMVYSAVIPVAVNPLNN